MAARAKTPLTIRLQKRRDAWERKVKIAYSHVESQKRLMKMYREESTGVLERYKKWLKDNNVEPIMDLGQYT